MQVKTDHQIVAFGTNLMGLFDLEGNLIVQATRTETGWLVTAAGATDAPVADRPAAITALIDTALLILPGGGYSCQVPPRLAELP